MDTGIQMQIPRLQRTRDTEGALRSLRHTAQVRRRDKKEANYRGDGGNYLLECGLRVGARLP